MEAIDTTNLILAILQVVGLTYVSLERNIKLRYDLAKISNVVANTRVRSDAMRVGVRAVRRYLNEALKRYEIAEAIYGKSEEAVRASGRDIADLVLDKDISKLECESAEIGSLISESEGSIANFQRVKRWGGRAIFAMYVAAAYQLAASLWPAI